jgi:hypothetical protein
MDITGAFYIAGCEGRMKSFTDASDQKGLRMTPNRRTAASLAFAMACLTMVAITPVARAQLNPSGGELITNGPQTNPGDRPDTGSATQNVRDSGRYDALVGSNPNFRAVRERKECGPIDDAKMHADCLATFHK